MVWQLDMKSLVGMAANTRHSGPSIRHDQSAPSNLRDVAVQRTTGLSNADTAERGTIRTLQGSDTTFGRVDVHGQCHAGESDTIPPSTQRERVSTATRSSRSIGGSASVFTGSQVADNRTRNRRCHGRRHRVVHRGAGGACQGTPANTILCRPVETSLFRAD